MDEVYGVGRSGIAVVVRVRDELVAFVQERVVDAPGVHADAPQGGTAPNRVAKATQDLVMDPQYIPVDPVGECHRLVGESVNDLQREPVWAHLAEDDPTAYAFMDRLELTEAQVTDLQTEIEEAGDPIEGANTWFEDNREVVEPWVAAAEKTREG